MESLILLLLLVPLLLLAFRGSKQRKQVAQMQSELGPGSEVMTTSGQFGTVVAVEGDRIELEVAPGITTWWLRQAVARQVDPVVADDEVEEDALDEDALDGDALDDDDVLADDDPRRDGVTDARADDTDDRPDGTRRSA